MVKLPVNLFLTVSISTLLLIGCSSGGGGSNDPTDDDRNDDTENGGEPKTGSITLANYQSILDAGFGGFGSFSESSDTLTESVSGTSEGSLLAITTCDTGSVNSTGTTLSPAIEFMNCKVGAASYNGKISASATNVSGGFLLDPPSGDGSLTATVAFENFSAINSDLGLSNADGALTIKITLAAGNETIEFSSNGLNLSNDNNGTSESFALNSLAITSFENAATQEESVEFDMSFKQIVDGKEVDIAYDTTSPFITADGEDNPRAGSMTIASSEGGKIIITANDDDRDTANFQLDVDNDGNFELNAGRQPWSSISGDN